MTAGDALTRYAEGGILPYGLTLAAVGVTEVIPLTQDGYLARATTRKQLLLGLSLEEKFDLLLENYAEMESTVLDIALHYSLFPLSARTILEDGIHVTNRRIANLLTTARLYLDHVPHELSSTYGDGDEKVETFRQATNREYDSVLGYRVMEALRNYVQHRSLPTHNFSLSSSMDHSTDPPMIRCQVMPSLNVLTLEGDSEFKKSVLAELKPLAGEKNLVSLLPLVRAYVQSLAFVHQAVRSLIKADIEAADALVANDVSEASDRFGSEWIEGLVAAQLGTQGEIVQHIYVQEWPTVRRKALESKNSSLSSLASRYITSQA
jgi:hypothetical protein